MVNNIVHFGIPRFEMPLLGFTTTRRHQRTRTSDVAASLGTSHTHATAKGSTRCGKCPPLPLIRDESVGLADLGTSD